MIAACSWMVMGRGAQVAQQRSQLPQLWQLFPRSSSSASREYSAASVASVAVIASPVLSLWYGVRAWLSGRLCFCPREGGGAEGSIGEFSGGVNDPIIFDTVSFWPRITSRFVAAVSQQIEHI